jgi:rhodanese-related sulfurtransferase
MDNIAELLTSGAIIIDVRTPAEYAEGHLKGSINMPLYEIINHTEELKKMPAVIVCCASGIRSNKAANILQQSGVKCLDGGSWLSLNHFSTVNQ